jgi:flagellar protein FliS
MKIPDVALVYREAASLGASPLGVIVLLYDRLVQDIHGSIAAMKSEDIEVRSTHVNHALLILQELQGKLDLNSGGVAAQQLDAFYSHIRGKLLEAQIRKSPELLLEQARALLQVRDCWVQLDAGNRELAPLPSVLPPAAAAIEDEAELASWGV